MKLNYKTVHPVIQGVYHTNWGNDV